MERGIIIMHIYEKIVHAVGHPAKDLRGRTEESIVGTVIIKNLESTQ